ncbi:MAG: TIGR03000 domain-containing protein [Gemmataceae bacterium]|nr:TIGR03000 domain-containing protein [Gemmataceae bacterium]
MTPPRLPLLLLLITLPGLALGGPVGDDKDRPAEILVYIPAPARLTIDGRETSQTGEQRRFVTPPLAPGRKFSYTLKATWTEGNRQIVRMAVARVEAGKETTIDLRHGSKDASSSQIIYVPTPQHVVDKMLEMAKVTKDDIVYDLGCGDGRVIVSAAKKYGARGVGVDIDPVRIKESLANLRKEKVEKLVEIRQGDALKVDDLSRATVVMTYMLPEFMAKLKPVLLRHLKPGTRIVAHDYPLPGWEPDDTATITSKTRLYAHSLFLWRVPERKE